MSAFDKPEKTLDLALISENDFERIREQHPFKVSEGTTTISSFQALEDNFYKQSESSRIAKLFFKNRWIGDFPRVVNFTFQFRPPQDNKSKKVIDSFLNYYHAYSNLLLTVPNIRLNRIVEIQLSDIEKKRKIQQTIISMDEYLDFVDRAYEVLKSKNNKPIFVPVSLKASPFDLNRLIDHYLKKEYYNYWFDFEGHPVDERKLAPLRDFFNTIKFRGYFPKIVLYFTNVRREIRTNPKSVETAASDVLCTAAGANIIGINRDIPRFGSDSKTLKLPEDHKAKELNRATYWYVRTRKPNLLRKSAYTSFNSLALAKEFELQRDYLEKDHTIVKMLGKKEMLPSFDNGVILKALTDKQGSKNADLSDLFGTSS